jgi:hypothetical protein
LKVEMPTDRLVVTVTYDERRGYVASHPDLPPFAALSLAVLRRKVEAALGTRVLLALDRVARQERDRRRREPR